MPRLARGIAVAASAWGYFRGVARIAILHPGAMGSAIGAALAAIGHEVVRLPTGRSTGTRNRAAAARLQGVDDLTGGALVISVVPPSAAVETAKSIAGFSGHVVDANAISPLTGRGLPHRD